MPEFANAVRIGTAVLPVHPTHISVYTKYYNRETIGIRGSSTVQPTGRHTTHIDLRFLVNGGSYDVADPLNTETGIRTTTDIDEIARMVSEFRAAHFLPIRSNVPRHLDVISIMSDPVTVLLNDAVLGVPIDFQTERTRVQEATPNEGEVAGLMEEAVNDAFGSIIKIREQLPRSSVTTELDQLIARLRKSVMYKWGTLVGYATKDDASTDAVAKLQQDLVKTIVKIAQETIDNKEALEGLKKADTKIYNNIRVELKAIVSTFEKTTKLPAKLYEYLNKQMQYVTGILVEKTLDNMKTEREQRDRMSAAERLEDGVKDILPKAFQVTLDFIEVQSHQDLKPGCIVKVSLVYFNHTPYVPFIQYLRSEPLGPLAEGRNRTIANTELLEESDLFEQFSRVYRTNRIPNVSDEFGVPVGQEVLTNCINNKCVIYGSEINNPDKFPTNFFWNLFKYESKPDGTIDPVITADQAKAAGKKEELANKQAQDIVKRGGVFFFNPKRISNKQKSSLNQFLNGEKIDKYITKVTANLKHEYALLPLQGPEHPTMQFYAKPKGSAAIDFTFDTLNAVDMEVMTTIKKMIEDQNNNMRTNSLTQHRIHRLYPYLILNPVLNILGMYFFTVEDVSVQSSEGSAGVVTMTLTLTEQAVPATKDNGELNTGITTVEEIRSVASGVLQEAIDFIKAKDLEDIYGKALQQKVALKLSTIVMNEEVWHQYYLKHGCHIPVTELASNGAFGALGGNSYKLTDTARGFATSYLNASPLFKDSKVALSDQEALGFQLGLAVYDLIALQKYGMEIDNALTTGVNRYESVTDTKPPAYSKVLSSIQNKNSPSGGSYATSVLRDPDPFTLYQNAGFLETAGDITRRALDSVVFDSLQVDTYLFDSIGSSTPLYNSTVFGSEIIKDGNPFPSDLVAENVDTQTLAKQVQGRLEKEAAIGVALDMLQQLASKFDIALTQYDIRDFLNQLNTSGIPEVIEATNTYDIEATVGKPLLLGYNVAKYLVASDKISQGGMAGILESLGGNFSWTKFEKSVDKELRVAKELLDNANSQLADITSKSSTVHVPLSGTIVTPGVTTPISVIPTDLVDEFESATKTAASAEKTLKDIAARGNNAKALTALMDTLGHGKTILGNIFSTGTGSVKSLLNIASLLHHTPGIIVSPWIRKLLLKGDNGWASDGWRAVTRIARAAKGGIKKVSTVATVGGAAATATGVGSLVGVPAMVVGGAINGAFATWDNANADDSVRECASVAKEMLASFYNVRFLDLLLSDTTIAPDEISKLSDIIERNPEALNAISEILLEIQDFGYVNLGSKNTSAPINAYPDMFLPRYSDLFSFDKNDAYLFVNYLKAMVQDARKLTDQPDKDMFISKFVESITILINELEQKARSFTSNDYNTFKRSIVSVYDKVKEAHTRLVASVLNNSTTDWDLRNRWFSTLRDLEARIEEFRRRSQLVEPEILTEILPSYTELGIEPPFLPGVPSDVKASPRTTAHFVDPTFYIVRETAIPAESAKPGKANRLNLDYKSEYVSKYGTDSSPSKKDRRAMQDAIVPNIIKTVGQGMSAGQLVTSSAAIHDGENGDEQKRNQAVTKSYFGTIANIAATKASHVTHSGVTKNNLIKAFPTFVVYFIRQFEQKKIERTLAADIYTYQNIIDFSIHWDKFRGQVATLTLANPYGVLDNDMYGPPRKIAEGEYESKRTPEQQFHLYGMALSPGVIVNVKQGYGSNPDELENIFSGKIAEVSAGSDVVEIVMQGHEHELMNVQRMSLDVGMFTGKNYFDWATSILNYTDNFGEKFKSFEKQAVKEFVLKKQNEMYTSGPVAPFISSFLTSRLSASRVSENIWTGNETTTFIDWLMNEDFDISDKSMLEGLHEMSRYLPGHVAMPLPYDHRSTFFLGPITQHYKYTDKYNDDIKMHQQEVRKVDNAMKNVSKLVGIESFTPDERTTLGIYTTKRPQVIGKRPFILDLLDNSTDAIRLKFGGLFGREQENAIAKTKRGIIREMYRKAPAIAFLQSVESSEKVGNNLFYASLPTGIPRNLAYDGYPLAGVPLLKVTRFSGVRNPNKFKKQEDMPEDDSINEFEVSPVNEILYKDYTDITNKVPNKIQANIIIEFLKTYMLYVKEVHNSEWFGSFRGSTTAFINKTVLRFGEEDSAFIDKLIESINEEREDIVKKSDIRVRSVDIDGTVGRFVKAMNSDQTPALVGDLIEEMIATDFDGEFWLARMKAYFVASCIFINGVNEAGSVGSSDSETKARQEGAELNKQRSFGRTPGYKNFREYHSISTGEIIRNEIECTTAEMANEVHVAIPEGWQNGSNRGIIDAVFSGPSSSSYWKSIPVAFDPYQPAGQKLIRNIREFNATNRKDGFNVAYRDLAEAMKSMYRGQLVIIGRKNIKPNDIIFLNDSYNGVTGVIEVASITHRHDIRNGWVTTITPHLVTQASFIESATQMLIMDGIIGVSALSLDIAMLGATASAITAPLKGVFMNGFKEGSKLMMKKAFTGAGALAAGKFAINATGQYLNYKFKKDFILQGAINIAQSNAFTTGGSPTVLNPGLFFIPPLTIPLASLELALQGIFGMSPPSTDAIRPKIQITSEELYKSTDYIAKSFEEKKKYLEDTQEGVEYLSHMHPVMIEPLMKNNEPWTAGLRGVSLYNVKGFFPIAGMETERFYQDVLEGTEIVQERVNKQLHDTLEELARFWSRFWSDNI